MGHGKETPRQKMIGMMYLVLTALLALNVSKDILNAFVIVNNGLQVTNENFKGKNQVLYSEFEKQLGVNPLKVKPYYDAAIQVQKLTQIVCDSITELKLTLVEHVEGEFDKAPSKELIDQNGDGKITNDDKILNLMYIDSKDNYDIPTHYMCGSDPAGKGAAAERFKNQLIKHKEDLLNILKNEKLAILNRPIIVKGYEDSQFGLITDDEKAETEDPADKFWETKNFYHLPLVACITMLSKIENDVRNAESDVVSNLLGQIGAADFKFDTLAGKVIPKATVVVQGDKYSADLFVAAFSTTSNPLIYTGEGYDTIKGELTGKIDSVVVAKGVGTLEIPASSVGDKKFSALIKVKTPTGDYKSYPIKDIKYNVMKPMAVVSPTKMNVMYIGVDNPMDISVSGFTDDKVSAGISQGSLVKTGTGWIAKVSTAGEATVSVSAKDDEGKSKPMGQSKFRVKRVPDPVAKVAGKREGVIAKNLLVAQSGVMADLENFDFDLKFVVKGFRVSAMIKGFEQTKTSPSNILTADQKAIINNAEKGQKVFFEDIKAVGPDGSVRSLSPIIFKLN
ncbi:MAG: hypothetical protein A2046_08385 [Bacteroidetes bacterium GWA2_30_7]|nr:MAG: hypothetical protein A2046_08385 [Bacteroidetes bacterium GWA2_30_7]